MIKGPRTDEVVKVPKAMIDYSLKTDGIDPNEL
jgi:hypothetical protein